MHDFILAKQIVDNLKEVASKRNIKKIKSVEIEIGSVVLAHDDMPEHAEEINIENLVFALENISKNTEMDGANFKIKKVKGNKYKIKNIEI